MSYHNRFAQCSSLSGDVVLKQRVLPIILTATHLPLLISAVAKEHFISNDNEAVLLCLLRRTSNLLELHATTSGVGSRKQMAEQKFVLHAHSSSFECVVRHRR